MPEWQVDCRERDRRAALLLVGLWSPRTGEVGLHLWHVLAQGHPRPPEQLTGPRARTDLVSSGQSQGGAWGQPSLLPFYPTGDSLKGSWNPAPVSSKKPGRAYT